MKRRYLIVIAVLTAVFMLASCAAPAAPAQTEDTDAANAAAEEAPQESAAEPADDAAPADDATEAATGESVKIGVSIPNIANPFYNRIMEGFEAGTKEGDEVVFADAGLDHAKQLADIEDMVNNGCDIICIDASDPKGIKAAMDFCKSKDIPVIIYDNTVENPELAATTIVSDNYQAGYLGGQIMADTIKEGNVAMYNFSVSAVCVERANGFKDAIEEFGGGKIAVVNEQEGDPTVDAAMPIMEAILQANPDIVGVWALNDPAALGCVAAIESAGKLDQVKVVAVDGNDEAKTAIKEGKMLATVAQDGVLIGTTTAETCYKVLAGETIEPLIYIPVTAITAENVDTVGL